MEGLRSHHSTVWCCCMTVKMLVITGDSDMSWIWLLIVIGVLQHTYNEWPSHPACSSITNVTLVGKGSPSELPDRLSINAAAKESNLRLHHSPFCHVGSEIMMDQSRD